MNTVTLNFRADGQQLVLTGSERFAANTVSYIRAAFELGDGWDGFDSIRAIWATDFAKFSTVLDPDGVCVVPWEVLKRVDTVMVNLVGSISDGEELTDRLTTYKVKALDVNGCTNIDGSETAEITPSQFEQFVAIVKEEVGKVKDISDVKLNADYTLTFLFSDGTEWTTPIPIRGEQGAKGETGNGISDIGKIGSQGRIDTYRVTYTNGGHFDFEVTNGEKGEQGETGNGIDRIEKTATVGSVDTYTIYFTDGSTTTFTITNGEVTMAQFEKAFPTDTASGSIASFPDGSDLFPMKSLKVSLEPVQDLSHGDPSPSNICPISGWDRVQAVRTGKNLLDPNSIDLKPWYFYANGTIGASTYNRMAILPCKPNTTYTFTWNRVEISGSDDCNMWFFDEYPKVGDIGNRTGAGAQPSTVKTYTSGQSARYVAIALGKIYTTDIEATIEASQLELGSTATDYHAYEGDTYTADLPQTVYGGTVDLVTGEYNTKPYYASYNGETLTGEWVSDRDKYVAGTSPTIGAQVVNIGADGTDGTITPQTIQTLQGTNNVWSDGDVEVEYKADVQLWVEKKLAG